MHPLNIGKEEIKISEIENSNNNKMIAIEAGLDYFYNKDNKATKKLYWSYRTFKENKFALNNSF